MLRRRADHRPGRPIAPGVLRAGLRALGAVLDPRRRDRAPVDAGSAGELVHLGLSVIAASLLVYREHGTAGVTTLLRRAFDVARIRAKVWYVPTVLLLPGIYASTYGVMRLMRLPLPAVQVPLLAALIWFLAYFIAGQGEELGWSGYALDPLLARGNALGASLLLGAVWA